VWTCIWTTLKPSEPWGCRNKRPSAVVCTAPAPWSWSSATRVVASTTLAFQLRAKDVLVSVVAGALTEGARGWTWEIWPPDPFEVAEGAAVMPCRYCRGEHVYGHCPAGRR
jgi:hypothetical protein